MEKYQELSRLARLLVILTASAFALIGLLLFLAPAWASTHFSWKISPFVAMTMGGWYLGSAVMAGCVAARRRWNTMYASALSVGLFSLSEAIVLVIHNAKLKLDAMLAWPYMIMLTLAVLASIILLYEFLRRRPQITPEGPETPRWARIIVLVFVVFVFFLSLVAFSGSWVGLEGVIFPEPLSLFTLHSFGAFYFSLAISTIPLYWAKGLAPITTQVQGGLALIVFITLDALIYLRVFNFFEHPFQSIYLGVYLAALAAAMVYLNYVVSLHKSR